MHSHQFQAVEGRRGPVVIRRSAKGSVWARRIPKRGQRPALPVLYLPTKWNGQACAWATIARNAGWHAIVRPGTSCTPWRSTGEPAPAWVCRIELPAGVTAAKAKAHLRERWELLTW